MFGLASIASVLKSKTFWVLSALAAGIAAAFFLHHAIYENGYQDGEQKVQAAWDADKAKQSAVALAAVSQAASDSQGNAQVAMAVQAKQDDDQASIQSTFQPIEERVKEYAKKQTVASGAVVGSGSNVLDDDGVRIWNDANAGSSGSAGASPSEHSQQHPDAVPGSVATTH